MSNVYTFYLGKELEKILKRSFKDNLDIIKILLKTVEKLLTPNSDTLNIDRTSEEGRDIFKITYPDLDGESQQRIFYYSSHDDYNGQKMYTIHSVHFPFKIVKESNECAYKVYYKHSSINKIIDSYILSRITTIFNLIDDENYTWGDTWVEEMTNLLYPGNGGDIEELFYVVNDLLMMDLGYFRYDNDPKHEKVNHPRNHLDIHLENRVTYKIGLNNELNIDLLSSVVDNTCEVKIINL
ncbi:hypothetical protein [uncultured Streptococcus sp.]|uniref:hypothetical protein n=1 Tax=uncultured Streptococcus sp. TaxID=83427 RepID=UPI000767429B|nr:hypothetical protein [uncultured Streptococcus sp.]KXU59189.1 hypothetical protein HMPREF3219_0200381 [Streptococcus salivarius]